MKNLLEIVVAENNVDHLAISRRDSKGGDGGAVIDNLHGAAA